jgi:hypothetical protein
LNDFRAAQGKPLEARAIAAQREVTGDAGHYINGMPDPITVDDDVQSHQALSVSHDPGSSSIAPAGSMPPHSGPADQEGKSTGTEVSYHGSTMTPTLDGVTGLDKESHQQRTKDMAEDIELEGTELCSAIERSTSFELPQPLASTSSQPSTENPIRNADRHSEGIENVPSPRGLNPGIGFSTRCLTELWAHDCSASLCVDINDNNMIGRWEPGSLLKYFIDFSSFPKSKINDAVHTEYSFVAAANEWIERKLGSRAPRLERVGKIKEANFVVKYKEKPASGNNNTFATSFFPVAIQKKGARVLVCLRRGSPKVPGKYFLP